MRWGSNLSFLPCFSTALCAFGGEPPENRLLLILLFFFQPLPRPVFDAESGKRAALHILTAKSDFRGCGDLSDCFCDSLVITYALQTGSSQVQSTYYDQQT